MFPQKIVIVGGSFGGINAAYGLRRLLGKRAELTVISKDSEFTFLPALPRVILGWRNPAKIVVPLGRPLARRGIRFVHGEVTGLDPIAASVKTAQEGFPYDILIIASGSELNYAAVPGLGPQGGYTQSTFSVGEAVDASQALRRVLDRESGRIVIGAAPGASCIGPAYEIVMMIDTVLRRSRRRHRFEISFLTPEPFLGHFGIGGVGKFPHLLEGDFADRDIRWVTNAQIVEAQPNQLVLADGSQWPFDFSLVIPAFLGQPFVREVEGLANAKGFINVTPNLNSLKFNNIYAAGVAVAIPPVGVTPVPVAVPKTGHLTDQMASVVAHNIAAEVKGGSKIDGLNLPGSCISDAGDTAYYFLADPFLPPRNKVVYKKGKWAIYLKLAFEKYYLAHIRHNLPLVDFGW